MKSFSLCIVLLCLCGADALAQEVLGGTTKEKLVSREMDAIEVLEVDNSCDSLSTSSNVTLLDSPCDSLSASTNVTNPVYSNWISADWHNVETVIAQRDSMIMSLEGEIAQRDSTIIALQDRIELLEKHVYEADWIMLRDANAVLAKPFDRDAVEKAKKCKIYSSDLEEMHSNLMNLINNYEAYYRDFQSILKQAQKDSSRISNFSNQVEDYKEKYTKLIEGMQYYKEHYHKAWIIKYLDIQIEEALDKLESHGRTRENSANFSELIDRDFDKQGPPTY